MRIIRSLIYATVCASFEVCAFVPEKTIFKNAFVSQEKISEPRSSSLNVFGNNNSGLTPLPRGISPFEKSMSKSLDIQLEFRKLAIRAILEAKKNDVSMLEIEFPPLIGGDKSKSQFDDFDNVEELDKNKDWTIQLAPMFLGEKDKYGNGKVWLVFSDLKECEIARKEWQGQRYQEATYTTIEAATEFWGGKYDAPWGANLVSGVSKTFGEKGKDMGLMGDRSSLDKLEIGRNAPPELNLVIQPGNGGPVEDWINVEKIYEKNKSPIVVINGALDKVRGGYYPGVFFPKLAATVDRFYKKFESAFYIKPISDKGVYGWVFRVYPEPWQVVLQTVETDNRNNQYVEDTVVHVSEARPSYNEAVSKLIQASKNR